MIGVGKKTGDAADIEYMEAQIKLINHYSQQHTAEERERAEKTKAELWRKIKEKQLRLRYGAPEKST